MTTRRKGTFVRFQKPAEQADFSDKLIPLLELVRVQIDSATALSTCIGMMLQEQVHAVDCAEIARDSL